MRGFSAIFLVVACTAWSLDLRSTDFRDGGVLPLSAVAKALGGQNLSPGLAWKAVPPVTQSMALIVVDEHPSADSWVHWAIINIPATSKEFKNGASAVSGKEFHDGLELVNSFGDSGWRGPEIVVGNSRHVYAFYFYALRVDHLDWDGEITWKDFQALVKGKIVAQTKLTALY